MICKECNGTGHITDTVSNQTISCWNCHGHGKTASLNEYQPAPTPNSQPAIWDLVVKDMEERNRDGIEKYGTPLQPFNGRDALIDAYQEVLDMSVYLRQKIQEEAIERGKWGRPCKEKAEYAKAVMTHVLQIALGKKFLTGTQAIELRESISMESLGRLQ